MTQRPSWPPPETSISHRLGSGLIVVSLCLLVCAVPLTLPSGIYQPVFSPKYLALNVCVALCCLGWLVQTRWGRRASLTSAPLLLPAVCWMAVGLITAPSTTHPLDTAVELFNQATLLILLVVVASALPNSRLTPVLWTSALTGLAVSLIGILQHLDLSPLDLPTKALPSATFINRNFAAEYLVCALPLSGLLFLRARDRLTVGVSGFSVCLMGVFLVYTRARGAWVGMAFAVLCVGAALLRWPNLGRRISQGVRERWDRRKGVWALGLLLAFLVLASLPPRFQNRSASLGSKENVLSAATSILSGEASGSSRKERFAFWEGTLRLVADHPLRGVAAGGWKRAYPPYDGGVAITTSTFAGYPHNDYLSIASEYGLIGLGVYLWFLAAGFRCLLAMMRKEDPSAHLSAPLFALSILAMLGDACFAFPKDMPHAVMFPYLLFGFAAGATAGAREREKEKSPPFCLPPFAFPLPFLFLFVSLGAVELSRRHVDFDRHYVGALSWAELQKDWPSALSEIRTALDYGTFQPFILVLKGYALQHLGREADAEAAYGQALAYAPHTWQAHHCLSVLWSGQGRLNEALSSARTALALCPSATIVRYNLGAICHQMGDHDRAEQAFRDVLRTDPGDAEARFNIGYLFEIRRNPDSAAVYYRQTLRIDPKMARAQLFLANLCFNRGECPEAVDAYRAFLDLAPADTANARLARERIAQCEAQRGRPFRPIDPR